jgi:hypothetical protein
LRSSASGVHVGNLAFTSTMTSSFATSHDDVDASVLPCRPVPPSCERYVSTPWAVVDWPRINRRLWAAVSHSISFAAAHADVSHRPRTRRGREPSKLVLAVLHPGLLSPKELRLD